MQILDAIVGFLFLVLLLGAGAGGIWQSVTASEFTARTLQGFAKYKYKPKWYHRLWRLLGSLILMSIGLGGLIAVAANRWRQNLRITHYLNLR